MVAISALIPPIRNTGASPRLLAIGDVMILEMLPVDRATLNKLFATPRFFCVEFLATRVEVRILKAPKLNPDRNKTRTRDT